MEVSSDLPATRETYQCFAKVRLRAGLLSGLLDNHTHELNLDSRLRQNQACRAHPAPHLRDEGLESKDMSSNRPTTISSNDR